MSPLDDYHAAEAKQKRNSDKQNNKAMYLVIAGLAITILVGSGLYFTATNNSIVNKDSQASNVAVSSSSSSSKPSETAVSTSALTKEEVNSARSNATELAAKNASIDVEKIVNSTLTSTTVNDLKTELGANAPTLKSPAGKNIELTIKYSSIGDSDFLNASLYVKLSEGLSIIPGSMKDNFLGRKVDVNDSVYKKSDNLITYGPGTSNKSGSPLKIGDAGTLTFRVQVDQNNTGSLAVASYIKEDSGKIGQPSLFFIDIEK